MPEMGESRHGRLRAGIVILAFLAVAMIVIMANSLKHYPEKGGCFHQCQIKSPVLATELAGSAKYLAEPFQQTTNPAQSLRDSSDPMVQEAAGKPGASDSEVARWRQGAAVAALRTNTLQDCVFIPTYAGFLLCTALLFAADTRGRRVPKLLGIAAASLAVVVALLDYTENFGILTATNASAITEELAGHISGPSRAKWTCLGADLLLLGGTIWLSRLDNLRVWVRWLLGGGFALTGVMLVLAVQRLSLFETATPSFGLLVVITAAGLIGPFFHRSQTANRSGDQEDWSEGKASSVHRGS